MQDHLEIQAQADDWANNMSIASQTSVFNTLLVESKSYEWVQWKLSDKLKKPAPAPRPSAGSRSRFHF